MRSFLADQSIYDNRIIAAMKNWFWICSFGQQFQWNHCHAEQQCFFFVLETCGIAMIRNPQQLIEKRHWRNRCEDVSSAFCVHKTKFYDCRCIPFLLRMFFVLNLSLMRSQKNTLYFGWHMLSHNQAYVRFMNLLMPNEKSISFWGRENCSIPVLSPHIIVVT